MNPAPPAALLLDVMGTLVRDPFYEDMPRFFDLSFEDLLAQKHPTAWIEFECDRIDEEELLEKFFLDRRPVDGAALRQAMQAGYRWLDGTERLLDELKRSGVEMHLFSNYPRWNQLIEEKLGLERFAPWTFVSWRTGLHKPDPRAYRHAARILGRSPGECLFVDDREVNCAAAREVGMPAIRFETTAQLRAELTDHGLLRPVTESP